MASSIIGAGVSSTIPPDGGLPLPVQGVLADTSVPGVIVNPDASPDDLTGWAQAQLRALDGLLLPISCGSCDLDLEPGRLATDVRELLLPALAVIDAARDKNALLRSVGLPAKHEEPDPAVTTAAPGASPRKIGADLEEDLTHARHIAVMVQWIGMARDFIEGVRWTAKTRPGLVDELRVAGVWINDPEWGECEGDALRHLHMGIETSIREIESKLGLGKGAAK